MATIADQVFMNGKIFTGGKTPDFVQALAIKNGRICSIGATSDMSKVIADNTEIIDLEGRCMLPAFIEAHCHAQTMAHLMFLVNVSGGETLEEYINTIRGFMEYNPAFPFILGNGWSNVVFPLKGPRKESLDCVSKEKPIAIWSMDHHSLWLNSKALEMARITMDSPNPPGGVIERDENGSPTGTLRESAANGAIECFQDFTIEQYKAGILEYQKMANAYGFTGCFDAMLIEGGNPISAYKELASSGELTMRFRGCYAMSPEKFNEQIEKFAEARGRDDAGDTFKISTIKIFADGVVEGGTAYLTEPYACGSGKGSDYRGAPIWDPEILYQAISKIERNGFQIHVHSIGDGATKDVLDAFEHSTKSGNRFDLRHSVAHLQLVDPEDICRFKDLGVVAAANPYWFMKDDYYYSIQTRYLGSERAEKEYPFKSFINEGVIVTSGSDFPVTAEPNPLMAIQIGMTRKTPDSIYNVLHLDPEDVRYKETLWPEEKADLMDMINSFTFNAAYANFLEHETGSLAVGKSADMIILDGDIFSVSENDIGQLKVIATIFKGEEVHADESYKVKA